MAKVSNMAVQNQRRGDTMSSAETLSDDAALQAKVAKNMAVMSDDGQPAPTPDVSSPTRKLAMPGKEPDPTPEAGSVEPDPLVPAVKADDQKTDDGPPAIPENYIAAAKHQGISDEEIAKMYETNPQGTVDFLKTTYEATNKLSRSFANLGRKEQEIRAKAVEAAAKPVVAPTVDYSAMEEEYGKDSAIVTRMKQQDTQIAELTAKRAAEPAPQQNVDAAMVSTLDSFFGADGMKPFNSFYGVVENGNWQALNAGEFAQREAVIEMAEQMILGDEVQQSHLPPSRQSIMPLDVALGKAHLAVSEGMRVQAIRADIKSQIKTKASGVTLAPSSSTPAGDPGRNADGTKTKTQLEIDTKARWDRVNAGKPARG